MEEEWRPVVGYEEKYEVSNFGRVRRLPYELVNPLTGGISKWPEKILKATKHWKSGRYHLSLTQDGKAKNWDVHQLVAFAFIGPRPEGKHVCHRDDDAENNTPSNLYYGTSKQNGQDKIRNRKTCWGDKHHAVSVTQEIAAGIWALKGREKVVDIARRYGVTISLVSHIHHGWAWNNLTGMPNPRT